MRANLLLSTMMLVVVSCTDHELATPVAADGAAAPDGPTADGGEADLAVDDAAAADLAIADAGADDDARFVDAVLADVFDGGLSDASPPVPVMLARSMNRPLGLTADGVAVYWLETELGTGLSRILRVSPTGGAAPELLYASTAPVIGAATRIVAGAGTLYFLQTESELGGVLYGGLYAIPSSGGKPVQLATEEPAPFQLALGTTHGYYSTRSAICRASRASGGAQQLLSSGPDELLAVDGDTLFYTEASSHSIRAASLIGADPHLLIADVVEPMGLVAAAGQLCYADSHGPILRCLRIDGGVLSTVTTEAVAAFASDGRNVYYATMNNVLRRASVTGGDVVELAAGDGKISGIAVDATNVYWVAQSPAGTTTVTALPK